VLIRCDKCQAQFSLQDGVVRGAQGEIPPTFAVECGRCGARFQTASPEQVPATFARKTPLPATLNTRAAKRGDERESASANAQLARALKPNRPAEPPDGDELFAQEMARIARRRKLLIGAVVLAAALLGAWLAAPVLRKKFSGLSPAALALLEKAHQKLLLDDAADLEQAAQLDQQAAKLAPGEARPEGERAFALLLASGAHKDIADRLEEHVNAIATQINHLKAERPEGWEKAVGALADETAPLIAEREPHVDAATRLQQQGLSAAKAALAEDPDEPSALRAMALYSALNDVPEHGAQSIEKAAASDPNEPFTLYVRARLTLSGTPSNEKQEKGLAQLALVREREPHLLRALYDTASLELDHQDVVPARLKLAELLRENPAHERAQRLMAPPPAEPSPSAPAPAQLLPKKSL